MLTYLEGMEYLSQSAHFLIKCDLYGNDYDIQKQELYL